MRIACSPLGLSCFGRGGGGTDGLTGLDLPFLDFELTGDKLFFPLSQSTLSVLLLISIVSVR